MRGRLARGIQLELVVWGEDGTDFYRFSVLGSGRRRTVAGRTTFLTPCVLLILSVDLRLRAAPALVWFVSGCVDVG